MQPDAQQGGARTVLGRLKCVRRREREQIQRMASLMTVMKRPTGQAPRGERR